MKKTFAVSLTIAVVAAVGFALSSSVSISSDAQHVWRMLSLPGLAGIFASVIVCSVFTYNAHGGGDPQVIALLSIIPNTVLFWGIAEAIRSISKRISVPKP